MEERRSEKRHIIPEINRKYVKMEVKVSDIYGPAWLIDLSLHGLRFLSTVKTEMESCVTCKISIPASMSREVSLTVKVHHCEENNGKYITGGEIVEIENTLWLDMFKRVHEFLVARSGEIY